MHSESMSYNDKGFMKQYHKRNINEESSWVDRVINGVPLDDTFKWEYQNYTIDSKMNHSSNQNMGELLVNPRNINNTIRESIHGSDIIKGSGESKNFSCLGKSDKDTLHRKWCIKESRNTSGRDTGKDKTFYRKRKVPKKRTKKYPVKPLNDIQYDKKVKDVSKFTNIIYDTDFNEDLTKEEEPIVDLNLPNKDEKTECEDYIKCYIEENPWNYAFINGGSPNKFFITHYNEEKDNYTYNCATDEYGTPRDYSSIMWCPPENWIKPVIYWDRIWTEMDYNRTGSRRPFTYYPEYTNKGINLNARIKFLNQKL